MEAAEAAEMELGARGAGGIEPGAAAMAAGAAGGGLAAAEAA